MSCLGGTICGELGVWRQQGQADRPRGSLPEAARCTGSCCVEGNERSSDQLTHRHRNGSWLLGLQPRPWGQTTQVPSSLSPKWDCDPKRAKRTKKKRGLCFLTTLLHTPLGRNCKDTFGYLIENPIGSRNFGQSGVAVLRGTIVNRTCGIHKHLHI